MRWKKKWFSANSRASFHFPLLASSLALAPLPCAMLAHKSKRKGERAREQDDLAARFCSARRRRRNETSCSCYCCCRGCRCGCCCGRKRHPPTAQHTSASTSPLLQKYSQICYVFVAVVVVVVVCFLALTQSSDLAEATLCGSVYSCCACCSSVCVSLGLRCGLHTDTHSNNNNNNDGAAAAAATAAAATTMRGNV